MAHHILSLGSDLIQRNWFGDDTLTARYGSKYKYLETGDTFDFETQNRDTGEDVRIPGMIIEEMRKIEFQDIKNLPREDYTRAGAKENARELYHAQFNWYSRRGLFAYSPFYLIFYKPPAVVESLKAVRAGILDKLQTLPALDITVQTESFSYHAALLNKQSLGPVPPEEQDPDLPRGPGIIFELRWDYKEDVMKHENLTLYEDQIWEWLEGTFGLENISVDDGSFNGTAMIESTAGPHTWMVQILGTPENLRKKLTTSLTPDARPTAQLTLRL